ncbi:MAG: hypothetical protein ABS84_14755 [Rubrivivax sp. SCN 71-131]|nr:MAG: hypothetical protein ABS84_14755 [Rubrivivax sp. SCN 71-131]
MDPAVEALRRLIGTSAARRQEIADTIGASEQALYQILRGIPLKSGAPRSVGRSLRERLDRHFPGWLDASSTAPPSPAAPTLGEALPVVLGRLPGLDGYTAGKVLGAVRAAIEGTAPLEHVERDLLQWLQEPRPASSGKHAAPHR